MTPGQPKKKFSDVREQMSQTDRVKEKQKKEKERIKMKHDREIDVAQERDIASKTRDKERALRMKRRGGA